jgi:peroxiredoxin
MSRLATGLLMIVFALVAGSTGAAEKKAETKVKGKQPEKTVAVQKQAPDFKIKDSEGKLIDLAKLTAKGPVLVRLTCGCAGCDKELAYFQALHKAYQGKGLTSLAIFREPDAKVEKYVKEKKLNMLYAVDPKGDAWKIFQTKTMPTNFLIEKGGRIKSIAAGCDPSGLIANILSKKVADLLGTETVDLKPAVPKKKESKQ